MKELFMVFIALLLGMAFGVVIRHYLDSKIIDEINELYKRDRADLMQTMRQRERMHINTVNELQKKIVEQNGVHEFTVTATVCDDPGVAAQKNGRENVMSFGTEENPRAVWLDMLNDVSEPAPNDDVNYGGF